MISRIKFMLTAIAAEYPVLWAIVGAAFFFHVGGLLPTIQWNVFEIMIGKNLLLGNGYIAAPLDSPAIWRPMLASFMCAFMEMVASDPVMVFRLVYAVSMISLLVTGFYLAKRIWGVHGFVLIFAPYQAYIRNAIKKYDLLGHTAAITFYNSEGWTRDIKGDVEAVGYGMAIKLYGSPESNGYSITKAISRNPAAVPAAVSD